MVSAMNFTRLASHSKDLCIRLWKRYPHISPWHWLWLGPLSLAGLSTLVFLLMIKAEFTDLAKQYDISQLESMESASLVYDRGGKLLGRFFIQDRDPVPFHRINKVMVEAAAAAEDQRFWSHGGVDYLGILRATLANWSAGRIRQGASTITQQLARNSFELKERTYRRKLLEITLAWRIEAHLSKEKIMELYLNRVYFGGGLYGVEAAARGYFGIPASQLSSAQAATLAGLLKSPNSLSPWTSPDQAQMSRNQVLARMRHLGMLTEKEYASARSEELLIRQRPEPVQQSYPLDYVRQQAIAKLGYQRAMKGGLRIHTTLDSNLQRIAEQSLVRQLQNTEENPIYPHLTYQEYAHQLRSLPIQDGGLKPPPTHYLQGAILAMNNATGGILVMVGGRDFSHSEYNRSVQGRRPVGTAFTPLVFAAAFENGQFPGDIVQDWALDNRLVGIGGTSGVLGEWGVETADNEYEGEITLREALVRGKNSATARVGFQVGLDKMDELRQRAGITSPLRPYANSYLGSSEMSLVEVTLAYTMFPGEGSRPAEAHIIDHIIDTNDEIVFRHQPKRTKVLTNSTAWQVHSLLTDSLARGTGQEAFVKYGLEVAAAGKTGTAYNFTDAWFFGYTSEITCGVWVGFDQPKSIFRGAFGRELALPVWVQIINASNQDFPAHPLKVPATVEQIEICRLSGGTATAQCTPHGGEQGGIYTEYYRRGQLPRYACPLHGGGVRSYAREYEPEQWPRAAPTVNLAAIPPIEVLSSPVIGSDPYNTVTPNAIIPEIATELAMVSAEVTTSSGGASTSKPPEATGKED
jgi:membrane carboxypeptidase/penicillin-binding protein